MSLSFVLHNVGQTDEPTSVKAAMGAFDPEMILGLLYAVIGLSCMCS